MTATQTNDNPDEPHSLTPRLRAEAADLDRDCTLGRRPAEPDCLQRRAAHFRRLSAALLDHVPADPGSALVDLGCGPTGPLDLMAGRAGPSGCVVGIELDPVQVESARNFARERGLANVAIVHGDARRTSLPSASRLPTTWGGPPRCGSKRCGPGRTALRYPPRHLPLSGPETIERAARARSPAIDRHAPLPLPMISTRHRRTEQ